MLHAFKESLLWVLIYSGIYRLQCCASPLLAVLTVAPNDLFPYTHLLQLLLNSCSAGVFFMKPLGFEELWTAVMCDWNKDFHAKSNTCVSFKKYESKWVVSKNSLSLSNLLVVNLNFIRVKFIPFSLKYKKHWNGISSMCTQHVHEFFFMNKLFCVLLSLITFDDQGKF